MKINLIDIKYEASDKNREEIIFTFKRKNKSIYKLRYDIWTGKENLFIKKDVLDFTKKCLQIYHMFVSSKTPTFEAKDTKEFVKKLKDKFYVTTK